MSELENLSAEIKKEFLEFLTQAQMEQVEFAIDNANELKELTELFLTGEISKRAFEHILKAQERTIRQNLNTLEIQSRARVEKILFGIIDLIKGKIIPGS